MGRKARKEEIKKYTFMMLLFWGITLLYYVWLFRNFTPIFGINDDWTMYMVLSGSYLGETDARVTFILYPLAYLISLLYKITTNIPWYGLILNGCFVLGGYAIFSRLYLKLKNKLYRPIISTGVLALYYCVCTNVLVVIQFTHAATILGATAIFLFITSDTKGKNWKEVIGTNKLTIVCIVLSLCMRYNAAFMCIPIAGMLFLARIIFEEGKITFLSITKYIGFISLVAVLIVAMFGIHKLAYSDKEWKEYEAWNKYRAKCADYYGTPNYEDVKEYVQNNGMSEEDYYMSMSIYNFYNGKVPASQFMKEIATVAEIQYKEEHSFGQLWKEATDKIVLSLKDTNTSPLNEIVLGMWILVVVYGAFLGVKKTAIISLFYIFGRLFTWYYILLQGRFPLRIQQGLFLIDIMALLSILVQFGYLEKSDKQKKQLIQRLLVFGAVISSVLICRNGIKIIQEKMTYVDTYQDRWYGVKEYCMSNPDNMYLLMGGSQTLYYFSDNVFDTNTIGKYQNYYSNSNFYSMSPACYEMANMEMGCNVAEELLNQGNNYWIYEAGCFRDSLEIVQFYSSKYETFKYELVDTFSTETTSFEVYHFRK